MLNEAAMGQIVQQWTATGREYPRTRTIHGLFEEQAALRPEAVAVLFAEQALRYGELNARANRLAHRLRRLGVGRGSLVGLCLRRCPEVAVALLGILKAGAAYVPLDPHYPDERLAFLLRDTAARVVLLHPPTRDRLRPVLERAGARGVDVAEAGGGPGPDGNPEGGATADDLAYVMYTSGSTGSPKGVLVGHRAVVRLVRGTDYCHFGPDEVFLQLAPLSFDASTFEVWGPLLNGGRLAVMPPGPPALDELGAAIRRHGVTTLWLTAGLFHLMVEQRPAELAPLRQLVAGGDVLSAAHVNRALEALADGVVVNGYGPTESTTFACCFRMGKGYRAGQAVPIGRPIANTTAYVLDEGRRPVPVGVAGELYLGGDGLAHGYLNNPGLTRERFVPDPFSAEPGARLYRTGDRVRWRGDGNLEFLGRFDSQVKFLGHRIEPGEIEATILQHPVVSQAAVVAHLSPRGEKQLVAYVVASSPCGVSGEGLKEYVASRLPRYMVPAHVVGVDSFPLTPNGKLDRSALPPPAAGTASAGPSATELEGKVTALWVRILDCGVGLDDNFFDLGGSSLQLLEVHAELRKLFGCDLCVSELFEHPTVRSLARRLAGNRAGLDPALTKVQDRARQQKEAFARQKSRRGGR